MSEKPESLNFIEQIVTKDIEENKHNGKVLMRFPPEPNGYLHLGHAASICLNFQTGAKFGGKANLRFDDTNPAKEEQEYVDAIQRDIKWLGFEWDGEPKFTSDYFGTLHEYALTLIEKGLAYVDDSSQEEIREMRGVPTRPGTDSPYRERSVKENLELFQGMTEGKYDEGEKVLRAKVDMTSPNMHMRDPIMYRILKVAHHRTGDKWKVYPMYDFAHGQSDSIEGITHSLCSLEFMHHRPLYDWFIEQLEIFPSKQTEFARMNVEYMITSKRKLLKLVQEELVTGWDDPRMPTISGLRRRGVPAEAIRNFCDKTGITKRENLQEISLFNSCVRDSLNSTAHRVMAVLDPVKVVITNYPDGQSEMMTADNNPSDENAGTREVPFSKEIYIERSDFMEDAPKKFFRLGIGKNVRLKHAFIITAESVEKDASGEITQINCTYYPNSKSGEDVSGIKAKGTLHWVSVEHGSEVEIRDYDMLFTDPSPTSHEGVDYLDFYNKESLVISKAIVEPSLIKASIGNSFQFIRKGYYRVDEDSVDGKPIFNKTISMKDSWAKQQKK